MERKPVVSVLAIMVNDKNEMLLIKQKTGPLRSWWLLPGGHVKFGETVEDAVVREVREETGLRAQISKLLCIFNVINKKEEYHFVQVVFQCKAIEGDMRAASDALDVGWFNLDQVVKIQPDLKRILCATGFLKL